jgi:hypothetical protein
LNGVCHNRQYTVLGLGRTGKCTGCGAFCACRDAATRSLKFDDTG